jgi:hypothetical protein
LYYQRTTFCCAFFFCDQNDSTQEEIIYKCFLFTVGSLSRKGFQNWVVKFSEARAKVTPLRLRLRQNSNDALVKQCDKCINVDGGHVEK